MNVCIWRTCIRTLISLFFFLSWGCTRCFSFDDAYFILLYTLKYLEVVVFTFNRSLVFLFLRNMPTQHPVSILILVDFHHTAICYSQQVLRILCSCSFCLCHLYPTPSRNYLVFYSFILFSIFFRSSYFSLAFFFVACSRTRLVLVRFGRRREKKEKLGVRRPCFSLGAADGLFILIACV